MRYSLWDVGLDRISRVDYASHVRAWRWHLRSQWLEDAAPFPAKDPGRLRMAMERQWRSERLGHTGRRSNWRLPRWM